MSVAVQFSVTAYGVANTLTQGSEEPLGIPVESPLSSTSRTGFEYRGMEVRESCSPRLAQRGAYVAHTSVRVDSAGRTLMLHVADTTGYDYKIVWLGSLTETGTEVHARVLASGYSSPVSAMYCRVIGGTRSLALSAARAVAGADAPEWVPENPYRPCPSNWGSRPASGGAGGDGAPSTAGSGAGQPGVDVDCVGAGWTLTVRLAAPIGDRRFIIDEPPFNGVVRPSPSEGVG